MEERTIRQIQGEVDLWVNQFKKPYFSPLSQLACMVEEIGGSTHFKYYVW